MSKVRLGNRQRKRFGSAPDDAQDCYLFSPRRLRHLGDSIFVARQEKDA
jgi:hypothetical protein